MKYIHLIGICGTGMGSLAGLFKEAGFKVTGSDTQFYPPMGDQLKAMGLALYTGFDSKNWVEKPDIVIIGNVCRKDNPEVVKALELGIKYYSLP